MALQTFSSFSNDAVDKHIAEELLLINEKAVIFQQLGEKAKMPEGEAKTFQYSRYNRINLPLQTLTEGTPPASSDLSLSTVQAVADQWGAYVVISDIAQLTIKHPLLGVAMELLGYNSAELVDREIINVLLDGTSITYGGAATSRAGLTAVATDSLTDAVCQKVVSRLRTRGAHRYEGAHYVGVIDPSMEQDVSQADNSAFVNASAYGNIKALFNGEIGQWRGVRWMVSNLIPTLEGLAAATFASPAGGTFAGANYRLVLAAYDVETGFLKSLTQNTAVAVTASDKLTITTPNVSSEIYKIFIGIAAGAAADIMYVGLETTVGSAHIGPNVAAEILAPPTSGSSIAGSDIPATAKKVHFGWVLGKQAYASVDLMNLKAYVSKPMATTVDPLVQQRTVGYKLMFKPVIQNENFMERIEVLSEFE